MLGPARSELPPTTRELVDRGCAQLGLDGIEVTDLIAAGRSGSPVLGLMVHGEPAVLKVTTEQDRFARALLELELSAEPELADFRPRLLAGGSDATAVFLVVERLSPIRPAALTGRFRWRRLAESFGALQSVPVPAVLRRVGVRNRTLHEIGSRREFWVGRCGSAVADRAIAVLSARTTWGEAPVDVLTHGDCHLENVLIDQGGRVRWIDWQEARVATGLADLVFLWQRTEFIGATPPRAAMLDAYVASRGIVFDDAIRRQLALAELDLLIMDWPDFLAYGSEAAEERLTRRIPPWCPNCGDMRSTDLRRVCVVRVAESDWMA